MQNTIYIFLEPEFILNSISFFHYSISPEATMDKFRCTKSFCSMVLTILLDIILRFTLRISALKKLSVGPP